MPFLIVDNYNGNDSVIVPTMDEVLLHFEAEEVAERSYSSDWPEVYEVVNGKPIEFEKSPSRFTVKSENAERALTDILAANPPLPRETAKAYAARINLTCN